MTNRFYSPDYGSTVNFNTANSKAVQKYLLKAFYNRIKKKYNLQIWQHNVYHTIIIVFKDIIISIKDKEREILLRSIVDITMLAEISRASSTIDLTSRY